MSQDLLKVKNELKKKKPVFRRVEKHRHPALPDNWRKPKGHHSKIRRAKRWEMKMPKIGRKTPVSLINHDKLGREIVMINTVHDLKLLKNNNVVGVVSGKLGLKKKSIIAKEAKGKDYAFINFKPENVLKKVDEKLASKKEKVVKEEKTVSVKPVKVEKPKKETRVSKPVKELKGDKK